MSKFEKQIRDGTTGGTSQDRWSTPLTLNRDGENPIQLSNGSTRYRYLWPKKTSRNIYICTLKVNHFKSKLGLGLLQ